MSQIRHVKVSDYQVQVDVGLVLEPQLDEVSDDVDVGLRVGGAVHGHRQQQVLRRPGYFRVHDPHLQLGDHRLANLGKSRQVKPKKGFK